MGKQNRGMRLKHVDEDNKGGVATSLHLVSSRSALVSRTTFGELRVGDSFQILPSESTPKKEVSPEFLKIEPSRTESGNKYNCEYWDESKKKFCWLISLTPVVPV